MTEKKGKQMMNEHQPSMTEWLAAIGESDKATEFKHEDNSKEERMEILYQTMGFPYERPVKFPATELAERSKAFESYLNEHGDDLCALRLVPTDVSFPKLRNRGLTVRDVYETWFTNLDIDPSQYQASFRPHAEDYPWAIILVIKPEGIVGEMIPGQHPQLTHGETLVPTTRFVSDFTNWQWVNGNPETEAVIKRTLDILTVDSERQKKVKAAIDVEFVRNYLVGYYEAVLWGDDVIRFGDYNRVMGEFVTIPPISAASLPTGNILATGATAYPGSAIGVARVIAADEIAMAEFNDGDILVTDNTDVRFVPLMKRAGAIVTLRGGILSHASIVARELSKPCLVGVGACGAVSGQMIEVSAEEGVVRGVDT